MRRRERKEGEREGERKRGREAEEGRGRVAGRSQRDVGFEKSDYNIPIDDHLQTYITKSKL